MAPDAAGEVTVITGSRRLLRYMNLPTALASRRLGRNDISAGNRVDSFI